MPQQILADITAHVGQVLVTEGTTVTAGDTLAILESMKMEIPVEADTAGTVTKLAVIEGDVLREGALIAEIS
ncbi:MULTISPECIES: biotin/lipoyl-binding carrier protein [Streptomyces]|uniref:Biotin/lipoyl-binding carrier protein n=1 Tax=Streptomyces ardesiacus TaxID=285564 RepID=A0ABW8HMB9_9ACTN|nr:MULTISPECIES: biotin/lipoyl-binding carrier protein [Streptomyces]NEB59265.1 biotin/lipoyl-binding carrier protein [Streptomyces diastaticus]KOU11099.1 acetyl-COA carboxylase [Streptomyces sp. NRRL F-4711]KOX27138.1 acetyl-COA carboxylase [Streptomyces sp. NRRL F-4707]KOX41173.1 acetyl-COA carboxylase [Streptomyces sp. NRRL F-7442]MCL7370163.1 biotin/lipoyl-binding carrier protein [Streptomyces ardesiacus]